MNAPAWLIALMCASAALVPATPVGAQLFNNCTQQRTAMYYGNGVETAYDEAMWTANRRLTELAPRSSGYDVPKRAVAYNNSEGLPEAIIATLEQKKAEDPRFSWFLLNEVLGYTLRGLDARKHLSLAGESAFIARLQEQVNAWLARSSSQPAAFYEIDLADQVRSYLHDIQNDGQRVLVIAHAQGNLYANAARAQIAAAGAVAQFGIAAIATPAAIAYDGYVTSSHDAAIDALRVAGRTVLPGNVDVPPRGGDVLGHGFEDVYLERALPARAPVAGLVSQLSAAVAYPAPVIDLGCVPSGASSSSNPHQTGTIAHGEPKHFVFSTPWNRSGVHLRIVDLSDNAFAPTFTILDAVGAQVASGTGALVADAAFRVQQDDTYTIVVSDGSSDTGVVADYGLQLVVAPGIPKDGQLTTVGTVSDAIDIGELDAYGFYALAGQQVQLLARNVSGEPLVLTLDVYDPRGGLVAQVAGEETAQASFSAQLEGGFTVIVSDGSDGHAATGAYQLSMPLAPQPR